MSNAPEKPPATAGPATSKDSKAPNTRGRGTLVVAAVLSLYALLLILLNNQHVTVHFVFFTTRIGLFWALALAVISGIFIGLLIARRRSST
jgi:uncharacterized integral membrane protein